MRNILINIFHGFSVRNFGIIWMAFASNYVDGFTFYTSSPHETRSLYNLSGRNQSGLTFFSNCKHELSCSCFYILVLRKKGKKLKFSDFNEIFARRIENFTYYFSYLYIHICISILPI